MSAIASVKRSRGFSLEQLEAQLTDVEHHLDAVESGDTLSPQVVERVDTEYADMQRLYLSRLTEYEVAALGAQILDIELRLKDLKSYRTC